MSERKKRVLIVDDDKGIQLATKYVLKEKYECLSAYHGDEARAIVQSQPLDIVLLDLNMRRENEGLEYLPILKEIEPDLDVIIVSANTEVDLASRAIKAGASAYLVKEHSADQLIITIESVLSKRELARENSHYVSDRKRLLEKTRIIGQSPAMKKLLSDIEKIRRSPANVIIFAETGCGKELVARHSGTFENRPFVAVDSATITNSMAESILFGHEKGAFTGAHAQQKGLFEEADGGTIYFDEIANMSLEIQAKLLRVVQEKEITRLGSTRLLPLEFRVICATNKDLEKLCQEGKFKDDLLQRLNVIALSIPPLRERREDIALLAKSFFEKFRTDSTPRGLSESALELLLGYPWPGNVRELSNLIANLCTMIVDQELVEVEDLPVKIRDGAFKDAVSPSGAPPVAPGIDASRILAEPGMDFYRYMHAVEGQVLSALYKQFGGNILQMSKSLKVSRSHLYSKLSAHGIHQ
jgi:DNA-binding NtrC family response regulator